MDQITELLRSILTQQTKGKIKLKVVLLRAKALKAKKKRGKAIAMSNGESLEGIEQMTLQSCNIPYFVNQNTGEKTAYGPDFFCVPVFLPAKHKTQFVMIDFCVR